MQPEVSHPTPSDQRRTARATYVIGAVGGVWILAHALGLLGGFAQDTYAVLAATAVTCLIVGIRRNQPSVKWPWIWFTSGLALFLIGGIARESLHTLGDLTSHRSLLPDLITIPGYLMASFGLLGIVRSRQRGRDSEIDTVLDAIVAALACLALGWLFVVNPSLLADTPLSIRLILAIYPTLSVFLVAISASLAFSTGNRRLPANNFLVASTLGVLVGDVVYAFVETHAVNVPTNIVDVPYALAFLFVSMAVLHPSMREVTEPLPAAADTAPTVGRLVIVAVALAIPGVITVTRVDAPVSDRVAMTVIVLSLTAAAITRLFRAVRAHARSEERLVHQATHDLLTGLPNRAYVQEYVGQALLHASATERVALMFLDVDRFKLVNDSYGHTQGDAFLVSVAQRLRASIRPSDLVARIGGDEFVVVASGVGSDAEALELGQRTRRLFAAPFEVRGAELTSTVSIGVAVSDGSDAHADAESMIRDADIAMYSAKEAGRDSVASFDASMRDRVSKRLDLERDLHHALERDELVLHYQPVMDIASGRVTGFEALIRWNHPAWGLVSPLTFIPVAEETGLIIDIGAWALGEACRQMQQWRHELPNGDHMTMAVNVSARQLRNHGIVGRVQRALFESKLPREALTLELTESTLMENPTGAPEVLGRLKALGIGLAIDDFGTGYSSLAYLRGFPVDTVKIDRAFVVNVDAPDSADATLVAAIVAMADALDITTIAEGVESETQAERLLELGCSIAQGFLYARPEPAAQVPDTVARLAARARARLRPVRDAFSA
jgi:diguanylate cyclase (GGDEF)-like protein